jgi:hypothetical protein
MKFTVKWPSLLIRITLSLKNPTMTRYNISGLFSLPKALPIRTSAPNARNDEIRLLKLSRGVGGQDKYDRYHHFGNDGDGTGLREQRGMAHHPPTATDHPHPQQI